MDKMLANKVKYIRFIKKQIILFLFQWWVLVGREMLCSVIALNQPWNWSVMVDEGRNAKAKTKDKSEKSHRGLFCSPEHREKAERGRDSI